VRPWVLVLDRSCGIRPVWQRGGGRATRRDRYHHVGRVDSGSGIGQSSRRAVPVFASTYLSALPRWGARWPRATTHAGLLYAHRRAARPAVHDARPATAAGRAPTDPRPPGPIRTEPNRGDEMTRPTPQLLAQRAARRGTVAPVPAETAGDAATAPRLPTTGAGALVRSLEALGVEVVFGIPGGAILPAYDPLHDSSVRHVLVRHEQGAGHAATGYAQASGRVGVCMATSGPGATNL